MTIELRVFLLRNNLTIRRIAETLGCSQAYISLILANRTRGERFRQRMITEIGFPAELLAYKAPLRLVIPRDNPMTAAAMLERGRRKLMSLDAIEGAA